MIVERGMQPNCSELIIRLGTDDRLEALEKLEEIGIFEYLIKNKYSYGDEITTEWDTSVNIPSIVEARILDPKIHEAYLKAGDYEDEKEAKKAIKFLKKNGIEYGKASFCLAEKDKTEIDGAWLSTYPYCNDGDKELAIWYHQHCTEIGFPMLKKIAEHFGSEVEAHDGGGIEYYNAFLDGRSMHDE